ncbi:MULTISPECIES: putative porin [unclassified Bradyrhizobium]|uniref:putative porin n=1 Tax=unclassified Bradyrhizobium TaxID=2631580 RepID=UPI0028E61A67|nr:MULTISPECIES: putative porin [unclassified Bradyrhizobium]
MFETLPNARRCAVLIAASLAAMGGAAPAFGQAAGQTAMPDSKAGAARPKLSDARPASPNATINLVHLLVKQGVLTEDQAAGLIKQADDEAYIARQAAKAASTRADEAAKAANAAAAASEPKGTRHVTYVPEIVKRQLREDIKREVMAKAEQENWASPGKYPEWAQRIRFYGDIRGRYQGSFFPTGNDQFDALNFNAVNTGSPYDMASPYNLPTYNTTQNRNQIKLRARLGMEADLTSGFNAGIRIATGESNSPVSTNQTMGGGGSNFSKFGLWLDRGYLTYQAWDRNLVASVGRFDNPFWSPTDLVWHRDLGFDGFAVQGRYAVSDSFTPFGVLGAFPIFNTDFNAGTNLAQLDSKFASRDKWVFGGQVGFSSRFDSFRELRLAAAFYDFENVQGQASQPCYVQSSSDICNTDQTRPLFAQKGNTYMLLRNLQVGSWNNFGTTSLYQYYGLLQQFRPMTVSASLDLGDFHPYHIVLDGEFVWNTAFNRGLAAAGTGLPASVGITSPGVALNNRAASSDGKTVGPFNGGDKGWMARVTVGKKEIRHLGDWSVHAGYKYLESDATVDAFVDSDFGLGGTNLKGYFLGGSYGLSPNVWASLRWLSANNIGGVPYAVDVVLVDLNAKF